MDTKKLLTEVQLGKKNLEGVISEVKAVLYQPLLDDLFETLVTLGKVEDYLVKQIESDKSEGVKDGYSVGIEED